MSLNFEDYAINGNEFVRLVKEELEIPDQKTGRIIRAVLHALRNRLSHEESFHLIAQLPMAIKGVYVDSWKFNKDFDKIRHINDFLDEVKKEDSGMAQYDFGNANTAKQSVAAVFKAISYFVSEDEMNHIILILPGELKVFIKEALSGKETIF